MLAAVEAALPADGAVFCAAVADYRPAIETRSKIKKERGGLTNIPLAENPDILKTVASMTAGRPRLVVGFAAETDDILAHAEAKRRRKGCDWIVANDVSGPDGGAMGGDRNAVTLISDEGEERWPEMGKDEVARRLAEKIAAAIAAPAPTPKLRAVKGGE
jgi:phosphopantothenoylcysteine decarboxylase/phosphopantothenate--cysteine ligase